MYQSERIDDKVNKQVSEKLGLPVEIIEAVVGHQWKSAHEATHTCSSIEISEMGKFVIREKKAQAKKEILTKRVIKLNEMLVSETNPEKQETLKKKINTNSIDINFINKKLKEEIV